jgi:hypothetical protein
MPVLYDRVLDLGLNVLDTEATTFHICSAEPTTFGTLNSLGNKTLAAGDIGAPSAGSPNGRQVTVAALTGGTVTATGTANSYAIVDTANSRLLATGTLSPSQAVTNGNTWSLASSFTIRIPSQ